MATRTVSVALVADVGSYVSGMARASASTKAFGSQTQGVAEQSKRGFDLAGKGAVLLGGAAVAAGVGLKSAISAASDLNETLNKSNVIFGANSGQIERWAKTSARDFGLSQQAALEAAASFGNMFQQLGFAGDQASSMSTDVVKLAADLGSFNNLETGDVLERIQAAFRGEYDSLQLLVPNINAARVETEALTMTGKKNKDELTAQEKATATLAIVQRDGAAAANDFAETSSGLANQTKIAAAEFEDLKARIGQAFLPIAQTAMKFVSDTAIPAMGGLFDVIKGLATGFGDLSGPMQIALVAAVGWAAAGGKIMDIIGRMGATSGLAGAWRSFGEALDYARANGDGLGTVLRSVGEYAGGRGLQAVKAFARAIGPELAVAGATLLIAEMVSEFRNLGDAGKDAREQVESLRKSLAGMDASARFDATTAGIEELRGKLDEARKIAEAAQGEGWFDKFVWQNPFSDDYYDGLADARASVTEYEQAIKDLEGQQARTDATASQLATTWGISKDQVIALADKYNVDLSGSAAAATSALYAAYEAQKAQDGAAADATLSTELYAKQLEGAAAAADDAKKQTDSFKLSLDILTGAHVSMLQVESELQSALADGKDAMDKMGGSVLDTAGNLNLQSENGRKASDVLLGVRDSGNQLIATMIEQGATSEQVQKRDAALREDFIKTAGQMGISRKRAEELANQILGIPDQRNTKITADISAASAAVGEAQRQIDSLKGRTIVLQANWANGGPLNGPMRADFNADGNLYEQHTAQIAPGGAWRVWAEPETGGEAYIPLAASKRDRSLDIWRETGRRLNAPEVAYFAGGGISPGPVNLTVDASVIERMAGEAARAAKSGVAGNGTLGGAWGSIWQAVKAAFPEARQNSTFRPGDPGYHGRGKAIDFGYGSGPGGAGNAGLAAINRFLHDRYGANLAELIYDGIGDDRPDLKNGRPLTYSAATQAEHRNHVHAAVYDQGGPLYPGYTLAYNGTGQTEWVSRSREVPGSAGGLGGSAPVTVNIVGAEVSGRIEVGTDGLMHFVDGRIVNAVTGMGQSARMGVR